MAEDSHPAQPEGSARESDAGAGDECTCGRHMSPELFAALAQYQRAKLHQAQHSTTDAPNNLLVTGFAFRLLAELEGWPVLKYTSS